MNAQGTMDGIVAAVSVENMKKRKLRRILKFQNLLRNLQTTNTS